MNHIFISYRRDDAIDISGRINDRLRERFGKGAIFKDTDKIPLGADFRTKIDECVSNCHVLLAVIGLQWLTVKDETGQIRLNNPKDFVRIEIDSALRRNIPVIPLLVQGVSIPNENDLPDQLKELAFRNGAPIRPDPDFHEDMNRLIHSIEQHLARVESKIWEKANNQDTLERYDDYVTCFPGGKFVQKANERIQALEDRQSHLSPENAVEIKHDAVSVEPKGFVGKMIPSMRSGIIARRMTLMLIVLQLVTLGVFWHSEVETVRLAGVIPPSLVGIGLIVTGAVRHKINEIVLGVVGGIAPWLLVFWVGPMATAVITLVMVLAIGFLVLKSCADDLEALEGTSYDINSRDE